MKKFTIFCALLFLTAGVVNAQITQANTQFPNPGFEHWDYHSNASCAGESWLSSCSYTDVKYVPTFWHTFDEINISAGSANHHNRYNSTSNPNKVHSGNYSIGLVVHSILGVKANGTMTTGVTYVGNVLNAGSDENYNYDNNNSTSYSQFGNGKFNFPFVGCPDSLSLYYQTSWASTTVKPMIKVYGHQGLPFYDKANGDLEPTNKIIFEATPHFPTSQNTWARGTSKLNYNTTNFPNNGDNTYTPSSISRPEYLLASPSTSQSAGSGQAGHEFIMDDLYFIYDKGLSSVSIGGTASSAALNVFNAAEWLTHEPSRTYDANGNPSFNNSGTASWNYTTSFCYTSDSDFPTVTATPKSKLITGITIVQASTTNHYATITVTHNDNSTFTYTINFTNAKPAPTVTASTNPTAVCAGASATLTATGANTYSWSTNQTGASIPVTPSQQTTYTVTGTASNGCTATANVTVGVNPLPNVSITGTPTICSGNSTTLTGNGASSYSWSTGSSATSISANAGGTYSVTGSSSYGCTATASVTVTEHAAPTVSIDGPASICSGTTATLTASGLSNYSWSGPATGSAAALDITAGGTYTVSGTDANGCSGTATKTVTGKTTPTVSINGTTALCDGATGTLSATVTPLNAQLTWTGGSHNNSLDITAAGSYTATANLDGCESSATVTVTAAAAPAAPSVTDGTRCGQGTVTLAVANPDADLTYHWFASQTAGSESGNGTTFTTPNLSNSATYYVSAKNAGGCYSARVPVTATINPLPSIPTVNNTSVCGENDIVLSNQSNDATNWYSDQNGDTAATANQHIAATTTFYAAIIDGNNCRSTLVPMTVTVNDIPSAPTVTTNPTSPICSNSSVSVTFNTTAPAGHTVKWYDSEQQSAGQGNQVTKTVNVGTTTYYAAVSNNGTLCESAKTPVEIVVNPLPDAPTVTNTSVCGEGDIVLSNQSSDATNWYSDQNGDTAATANQHIAATTTFYAAIIDGNNCRSTLVPMTVTANPIYTDISDTKTACGSYTWEGTTYTESGDYTKTLQSVNGCDSTVTLHLTINNGYTVSIDSTVCNQFVWQGETYTTSQVISKHLTSLQGCDSLVTINLTVKHSSTFTDNLVLCSNQLPYDYAGTEITSAGVKTITLMNAEGCDSVITLTVTVNPQPGVPTITATTLSRCGAGTLNLTVAKGSNSDGCRWYTDETDGEPFQTGLSYQPNLTESTTYYVSSYSNAGCESGRIPVAVTVNPVPEVPTVSTENTTRCGAGEVVLTATVGENGTQCRWYGNNNPNNTTVLSSENSYTVTFNSNTNATRTFYVESYNDATGCKSTTRVAATATENPVPAAPQVTAASHCGTLTADLADYVTTSADLFRWYDSNEEQLAENAHYSTTIEETTTFLVSVYNNLTTCESQKTPLTVTIHPTYEAQSIYDTICQNTEYQNHGISQTFTEAGEQSFVLNTVTANGCDSLVTLYIYVKPQVTHSITAQACDQYTWNNETYNESGVYTQTFTAANGCDSIVTLTLTINTASATEFNATACESYTWNEVMYVESGDYTQEFTNANGCDSIVTLHLTINSAYEQEIEVSACVEYEWNGETYTESGDYTQSLTSSQNCDSIVTMHLTIHQPADVELYDQVCVGSEYTNYGFNEFFLEPGEETLTSEGQTVYGCDSTTTLHLTILPVFETELNETICQNSTFVFNGEEVSEEGDYTANLTAANGCDSTVTLHLSFYPQKIENLYAEICAGESYNEYGFDIAEAMESQDYELTSADVNGCDSLTILHLTVHQPAATTLEATLCLGGIYSENDFEFTATETGYFTMTQSLQTVFGCDSLVTLNITVNPTSQVNLIDETCQNAVYEQNGFEATYDEPGEYTLTNLDQNVYGCDSLTILTLTVHPVFETEVRDTICFNGEYDFHGEMLNETGDYTTTLATVNGCDSVINLHLYVRPEKRREISADICEDADYNEYDFAIAQANESQDYEHTVADVNGCDSTTVLHLTVHKPAVTNIPVTLCLGESYNNYGFQFTASETTVLTQNLQTVYGCDSTVNLQVTVNPTHHVLLSGQTCAGEPYNEYGFDTLFAQAGTYTLHHNDQNVFGCDSVTELSLTVRPVYHQNISRMICENGSFVFNGQTLTEAGIYTAELQSIYGCDSIVTLNLSVGAEYRDTLVAHVCYGNDYTQYGFDIENATATGYHEQHTTAVNGCDSTSVLHLIVHELNTTDLYATLCLGEYYRLNGFNVTATKVGDTTYTRIVPTMYGCDSTVVLHLTVNPTSTVALSDEICAGNRYEQNGFDTLFTEANTYTLVNHDQNVYGCDSTTTLTLTVWPNLTAEVSEAICFNTNFDFNGTTLTEAGTYLDTLPTIHGCDSIITLHLDIYPENTTTIADTACVTYTWNDETYTETGVYTQLFTDIHGCDSTVTLNLVINAADTMEIADTACVTYTWNNVTYTTTGDYSQSFLNVNGCDSTVTLHLVINAADTMEISEAACLTYTWNDETYTESGDYTQSFLNVNGCDSTVTLHLTIHSADNTEFAEVACVSYAWNDSIYTQSGDYIQHFQNINGCDSTVTLHLTINPADNTEFAEVACVSFTWNDSTYMQSGDYVQHFQNVNGCDSTVTLHLTINPADNTEFAEVACVSFTWNDSTYTQSGDYVQYFQNVNGCDSTVTLHLTINPADNTEFTEVACVSYTWNDSIYTQSGDYIQHFQNVNGCDSTVTLHLVVNAIDSFEFDHTACVSYTWNDSTYTESGNYIQHFQNVNGCDSTVTLHLTINPADSEEFSEVACVSYTWNDSIYTQSGDYVQHFQNVNGCDSTVTLHLTINPTHSIVLYDTICLGEHYMANGFDTLPTAAGAYIMLNQSQNIFGCDSATTLHLTVNPTADVQYTATVCLGTAFNQYGFDTLMTAAGVYTLVHEGQNIHGCDSTTTVTLTVNPTYSADTTVNICDVEVPYMWDDEQYWETGDYTIPYSTVNGCDSIVNLHLNVNPTYSQDTAVTVCQGALPYWFDDEHSFSEAGLHTINLTTVNGCDSVWHLQLTITPNSEHSVTHTICASELPYSFMDSLFTEAGQYDITESDADNCLTITHFTLNVNATYHGYDTVTVCEETLPYTYGTTALTESGDFDIHFSTVNSCDSLVSVHFTVIPTATGAEEQWVCVSDFPVVYGGETFTQEGVYTVTFHRDNLCDSVVTFTLHQAQEYLFTETDDVCDHALPYEWRGMAFTQTGVYYDSLTSQHGCDSVYQLNLTVNETQLIVENPIVLCNGESELWRGMTLTESGTYRDTVSSATTGCHEIHEVTVTVNPTYLFHDTVTICSDELPYSWHGMTLNEAGVREDYHQTVNFCDSIYRITLVVNPSYHATETASACDYDLPYLWHGQSLTTSGTYYDTLTTVNGCDSTFALTFTVNPSSFTAQADTVCNTELPYLWRGMQLTAAGTYHDTIPNSYGCEDVYEMVLTVNQSDVVTIHDTICQGGWYTLNGFDTLASQAGTLYDQLTLTNANGCDSVVNLILQVMPTYLFETTASTCENVPYEWRNGEYSVAGDYYDSLTTQHGCDSVYVLHLSLNPTFDIYVDDTAMAHHEYTYDNFVVTPADSGVFNYDIQYLTLAGCDSIVHLTLYVAFNDGIDDYTITPEFSFYPNPTSVRLNIRGERMRTVEVFNINGKLVGRSDAETPEFTQIEVSNLPTGHYLVKVTLDDGKSVTGKVVVNRR